MNKQILLSIFCLFTTINTYVAAQTYSGGSGTETDPYLISSKADMEALATAVFNNSNYSAGKYFLLTQDITEAVTTIIGGYNSSAFSMRAFSGIFDGAGHKVNVNINSTESNVGVFGYAYGATIKNLDVTGSITRTSNLGGTMVGGICGEAFATTITNCFNRANISVSVTSSNNLFVGGICGDAYTTTITNCIATNATITTQRGSSGMYFVGRILGRDYSIGSSVTVQNCFALATMQINGVAISNQNANSNNGKDFFGSIGLNEFGNIIEINNYVLDKLINYGDVINLNNNNFPITFQSSDNSIAEITNNVLKTKKAGNVVITVNYSWESTDCLFEIQQTVNRVSLSIQADTFSIIYGETPPQFTCKYEGFVFNETEAVLTKLPTFSCSGSSTSDAEDYIIIPSSAEAENYFFTYKNGLLKIGKRDLQVIPNSLSRLYGDNNPTLTLKYEGFVNGNTAWDIYPQPTPSTIAAQTSPVGNYEITCSGGSATNYNFIYENGNLEITKAPLTVTPNNSNRLYGAENPIFTLSYSGFKNSETKTVIQEEPQTICEATPTTPVGQYPITASEGNAQNYSFVYNTGTLTINKATVTIQADTITSIYGDTPQFTCKYEGFVNSETENVLTKFPLFSCSGTATSNVGNYNIIPSGAEAENYTFIYKNGLLKIEKRDLRVIPDNFSRLYGNNNPLFTMQYEGFVNGNTASNIYQPTANTIATNNSPAGNYEITCSGGSATNYNIIYEKGNLEITKAPLTITAHNKNRYWGVENPILTFSYSGFKNNENESILTEQPQISCIVERLSPSGQYPIIISGGVALNYDIIHINGIFTVNKNPQWATVTLEFANHNIVSGMGNSLMLSIEQEDPLLSFQTDITFPAFVSVDLDKVTLSNRCDNAHVLNATKVPGLNNTYRFLIYSPSNKAITGNTGKLITIPLVIDWNIAPSHYANYTVSTGATSAVFYISESEKPEKSIPNTSTGFYIHPMGDVNINGTVTISDIVAEVDYILGKNPQPFLFEAGDMNKNGMITILDLTLLVNTVLTQNTFASSELRANNTAANANYELSLSNLELDNSKGITNGNLILSMNNPNPVIALNWDLTLPENVTIDEAKLAFAGDRTNRNRHIIAVNKLPEGNTWRFVVYSSQNQEIGGNSGELITIPVSINEQTATGQFLVSPSNAVLIYSDAGNLEETAPISISGILAIGEEITTYPQTIDFPEIPIQTYGNPTIVLNQYSSAGLVITYTSDNNDVATVDNNTLILHNAGTAQITAIQNGNANYNAASPVVRSLVIEKALLTITAENKIRKQGEENPVFTLLYSGFKNSENESILDVLPTISCEADINSPIGTYDIVLSGGLDKNYNYNLINGILEVEREAGIKDISIQLSTYPNPAKDYIFIQSDYPIEKIEIYNQSGICVLMNDKVIDKLDVSSLPNGFYFARIYIDGMPLIKKIIIKK